MQGNTKPRLYTRELRKLTRKTSKGYAVIDFAEKLGISLMPWQRQALIRGLELRSKSEGGGYRFRTVLVLVARQNGKTTLLKVLSLWRLLEDGAKLVLGTSTNLDTARESWEGVVELSESSDEIAPRVTKVRRANGEQSLVFDGGKRYKIAAANRRGGRGLSIDLGIADELREHASWDAWGALDGALTATPDPQLWALSNAGDDTSVVLNHLREQALGFIETGEGDDSLCLLEWSAPDECDLEDRAGRAQANPALGITITEATLASKAAKLPPNVYRIEHLCQRVASLDDAIPSDAWRSCHDPQSSLDGFRDRVALCLDASPDMRHITLVAAALGVDGRARIDVVGAWESPEDARNDLPTLLAEIKPRVFGWFPSGPAAGLAADLVALPKTQELRASEVAAACQGFAEQVTARRVIHNGDPLLMAQVTGVSRLYVGDGWRFVRKGAGHADAAYAAAGAVHLARTLPKSIGKPRLVIARQVA
jgi:hypothetical protein